MQMIGMGGIIIRRQNRRKQSATSVANRTKKLCSGAPSRSLTRPVRNHRNPAAVLEAKARNIKSIGPSVLAGPLRNVRRAVNPATGIASEGVDTSDLCPQNFFRRGADHMTIPKHVTQGQGALHDQPLWDERGHCTPLEADGALHDTEPAIVPIWRSLHLNSSHRKGLNTSLGGGLYGLGRVITTHLKICHLGSRCSPDGQIEIQRRPEQILERGQDMEQGKGHTSQKCRIPKENPEICDLLSHP